jgi:hypothetical protein
MLSLASSPASNLERVCFFATMGTHEHPRNHAIGGDANPWMALYRFFVFYFLRFAANDGSRLVIPEPKLALQTLQILVCMKMQLCYEIRTTKD